LGNDAFDGAGDDDAVPASMLTNAAMGITAGIPAASGDGTRLGARQRAGCN
jgi:hypothetical protein